MTRSDDWANHLDPGGPGAELTAVERDGLNRIAGALADEALWGGPPASLRGRLLAQAAADPGATTPAQSPKATTPAQLPGATTPAQLKAQSRWFGRVVTGAVAAAIAVVATIGVTQILADNGDNVTTFAAVGTELALDARADVDVEPLGAGVAITLNITGLPSAGDGEYYAGWLTGDEGQVPIGSFHWREGGIPIELWSGVDIERYPRLGITLQREGEPTTSNGELVLTADLAGAPISD